MSKCVRSYVKTPVMTDEIKRTPLPLVVNISACAWYGTLATGIEQLMCRCMDAGMPKEVAYDVTVDALMRAAVCAIHENTNNDTHT